MSWSGLWLDQIRLGVRLMAQEFSVMLVIDLCRQTFCTKVIKAASNCRLMVDNLLLMRVVRCAKRLGRSAMDEMRSQSW